MSTPSCDSRGLDATGMYVPDDAEIGDADPVRLGSLRPLTYRSGRDRASSISNAIHTVTPFGTSLVRTNLTDAVDDLYCHALLAKPGEERADRVRLPGHCFGNLRYR